MTQRTYAALTKNESVLATTADADATLLYTCPLNHDAEIVFLTLTNGGATITTNVELYSVADLAWKHLTRSHSIAAGTTYNVLDGSSIYLRPGDKISVYKSGGTLDATVSVKQYYNPTRS